MIQYRFYLRWNDISCGACGSLRTQSWESKWGGNVRCFHEERCWSDCCSSSDVCLCFSIKVMQSVTDAFTLCDKTEAVFTLIYFNVWRPRCTPWCTDTNTHRILIFDLYHWRMAHLSSCQCLMNGLCKYSVCACSDRCMWN